MYIPDWHEGIYQSKDGGYTWNFLFKPAKGWNCWQAVYVPNSNDEFWTLAFAENLDGSYKFSNFISSNKIFSLCLYTINCAYQIVSRSQLNEQVDISWSKLIYYNRNIMLLAERMNNAIHAWLINGQYSHKLLNYEHNGISSPYGLAVDNNKGRLYVDQNYGTVKTFKFD